MFSHKNEEEMDTVDEEQNNEEADDESQSDFRRFL